MFTRPIRKESENGIEAGVERTTEDHMQMATRMSARLNGQVIARGVVMKTMERAIYRYGMMMCQRTSRR